MMVGGMFGIQRTYAIRGESFPYSGNQLHALESRTTQLSPRVSLPPLQLPKRRSTALRLAERPQFMRDGQEKQQPCTPTTARHNLLQ